MRAVNADKSAPHGKNRKEDNAANSGGAEKSAGNGISGLVNAAQRDI
jgi:hypothetical protein